MPSGFRRRSLRRGMMLLEVVLALAILVSALAVIGVQFNTALRIGYENERLTQALMLAEAKLGQLDVGAVPLEHESFDAFGHNFPGFFWRFQIDPHDDLPGMFQIRLDILYGHPEIIVEPGDAVESDLDDAEILATLHTVRPTPPNIDLQRDFGLTDDQVEEIALELPPELGDPTNISPAVFAEMDPAMLMEILPQLLELLGPGFGFSQSQLDQALQGGLIDPNNLPGGLDPGALLGEPGDDGERGGGGRP